MISFEELDYFDYAPQDYATHESSAHPFPIDMMPGEEEPTYPYNNDARSPKSPPLNYSPSKEGWKEGACCLII